MGEWKTEFFLYSIFLTSALNIHGNKYTPKCVYTAQNKLKWFNLFADSKSADQWKC